MSEINVNHLLDVFREDNQRLTKELVFERQLSQRLANNYRKSLILINNCKCNPNIDNQINAKSVNGGEEQTPQPMDNGVDMTNTPSKQQVIDILDDYYDNEYAVGIAVASLQRVSAETVPTVWQPPVNNYRSADVIIGGSVANRGQYVCPISTCGERHSSADLLTAHIRAVHPGVSLHTVSSLNIYGCRPDGCGKQFVSQHYQNRYHGRRSPLVRPQLANNTIISDTTQAMAKRRETSQVIVVMLDDSDTEDTAPTVQSVVQTLSVQPLTSDSSIDNYVPSAPLLDNRVNLTPRETTPVSVRVGRQHRGSYEVSTVCGDGGREVPETDAPDDQLILPNTPQPTDSLYGTVLNHRTVRQELDDTNVDITAHDIGSTNVTQSVEPIVVESDYKDLTIAAEDTAPATDPMAYPCLECDKAFATKHGLQTHKGITHRRPQPVSHSLADQTVWWWTQATDSPSAPLTRRRALLCRNIERQTGGRGLKSMTKQSTIGLQTHNRMTRRKPTQARQQPVSAQMAGGRTQAVDSVLPPKTRAKACEAVACRLWTCGQRFRTKHCMYKHVREDHPHIQLGRPKRYRCPRVGCDRRYESQHNLDKHVVGVHERTHQCPHDRCSRSYDTRRGLNAHTARYHPMVAAITGHTLDELPTGPTPAHTNIPPLNCSPSDTLCDHF